MYMAEVGKEIAPEKRSNFRNLGNVSAQTVSRNKFKTLQRDFLPIYDFFPSKSLGYFIRMISLQVFVYSHGSLILWFSDSLIDFPKIF